MGRYIKDVELKQPIDIVSMLMDDYVYHNRFIRGDWNGEMVYFLKDSHGKERYLEWHYVDGTLHLEAWLKSPFGNEQDLKGGGASRKEFRESIENIIQRLQNQASASVSGGHIGSDPLHHDSGAGRNHDVWKGDTGWQRTDSTGQTAQKPKSSTLPNHNGRPSTMKDLEDYKGLMFAVLALVFGGVVPIVGIIFSVLALKRYEESMQPRAVKIIAIIAIVIIAVSFICNILFAMFGYLFFRGA